MPLFFLTPSLLRQKSFDKCLPERAAVAHRELAVMQGIRYLKYSPRRPRRRSMQENVHALSSDSPRCFYDQRYLVDTKANYVQYEYKGVFR